MALLGFFVGRSTSFDNSLFKKMLGYSRHSTPWLEGIEYIVENGKDIQMFNSIKEVFEICQSMYVLKYFYSKLGLPWTVDNTGNNLLLSKLACYNGIEDVKWAYSNGCKGGDLVPYVRDEWDESTGIRHEKQWRENHYFLEEKKILDIDMIELVGDTHIGYFMTVPFLKFLAQRGYRFASETDKLKKTKTAFKKCCEMTNDHSSRRKLLALFQQIGIRQL